MSRQQLKPKNIIHLRLGVGNKGKGASSSEEPPISSIDVLHTNNNSCDSSFASSAHEDQVQVQVDHHHSNNTNCKTPDNSSNHPETETMNASPLHASNDTPKMTVGGMGHPDAHPTAKQQHGDEEWAALLRTSPPPPAFPQHDHHTHSPTKGGIRKTAATSASAAAINDQSYSYSSSKQPGLVDEAEADDEDPNWIQLQKKLTASVASSDMTDDPYEYTQTQTQGGDNGGQQQEEGAVMNPFASAGPMDSPPINGRNESGPNNNKSNNPAIINSNNNSTKEEQEFIPKSILRRPSPPTSTINNNPTRQSLSNSQSSTDSTHSTSSQTQQHQNEIHQKQQLEIQSILSTLEDLQNNFVTNDNSTSHLNHYNNQSSNNYGNGCDNSYPIPSSYNKSAHTTMPPRPKEYIIQHYPNGDLFSGNVDAETRELIYGRMTCALEMEVYEGPFWRGRRHGEGAVCCKMDGGAKFLGRYHEGQMHSGTLIVTRNDPSDFTYTGTFLNNDFHGIGTIVSQNGSIYQGQFAFGVYHGVGTLRTVSESLQLQQQQQENDDAEDNERGGGRKKKKGGTKMESVYTGDFSEGLFHGSGSLTHSDNSSYIGTWSEGQRVEGTETLSNGDIFEGKFINDVRQGQGVLTMKCGRVTTRGIWEGDVLKEGCHGGELNVITFGDGHVYQGDHLSSVPHGFGRMEYVDSGSGESAYTGWFVNGLRHGEGRCFFHKTGEEYDGEWVCDEPIDLKLFQHDGPLVIGSNSELSALDSAGPEGDGSSRGEQDPALELIQCLNKATESSSEDQVGVQQQQQCNGAPITKTYATNSRSTSRRSSIDKNEMNSSLVSAASSGAGSDESIALSSIEGNNRGTSPNNVPPQGGSSKRSGANNRTRTSTYDDSDNLSLSMKSLSVFDYTEGLKIYRYHNGDVFKGRLDKTTNLRQGSGIYTEHRMGTVYNGDWKDSKRHGVGHLKLASGAQYSGEFFDDKIHGQGSLTRIDGSVYTGSFFNGLFHGRGMLEDEDHSRVYFGEFEDGERSGEGEEKFSDKSRYKGGYSNGERNGMGVLFSPDGSELYRGEWYDDLRHGKGLLLHHRQEGSTWEGSYEGDFNYDKFSGNGRYTYTDGTSIEGQWLDDTPRDGDWSIKYTDGSKFYGFATFQHSEEKSVMSDGSRFDFLRVPLPHGFGSLTYPSGQRFVGSFVYGEFNSDT